METQPGSSLEQRVPKQNIEVPVALFDSFCHTVIILANRSTAEIS